MAYIPLSIALVLTKTVDITAILSPKLLYYTRKTGNQKYKISDFSMLLPSKLSNLGRRIAMKIQWFGQSCFLFTSKEGKKILIDPFNSKMGYKLPYLATLLKMRY